MTRMPALDQEQFRFVLESAILAPSADNQHRIRFSGDGDRLDILCADAALPPEDDFRHVLDILALGAVAENIAIAAARYGIGTTTTLSPSPTNPKLLLSAEFGNTDPDRNLAPLCAAVARREVNRRPLFRGPALTADQHQDIARTTASLEATRTVWLDEPAKRRLAVELIRSAEGERFRNPALHRELFSSIRFETGWTSGTDEGLPPGALGIEVPLRPIFASLANWKLMRALNAVGLHHLLGLRAAGIPCRVAPHLAVLTVKNFDTASIFAAGRALQRIWLQLTCMDFVAQPLAAATLYALPSACRNGIPPRLQQRLAAGWQGLAPESVPLIVLRIGRAAQMPVRAGRLPADRYWSVAS